MSLNTGFSTNLRAGQTVVSISSILIAIVVLVSGFAFFCACSSVQFPEHVYERPPNDLYRGTSIGVFKFSSPEYAPGSGYAAATMFYKELVERGFTNVAREFDVRDIRLDNIMEIAEKKNYELIITGKVSYYISGGKLRESRVDEEIRVIDIVTGATIWYADLIEIGKPEYPSDYIFFSTKGKEAPPPMVLMRKNARKYCNMFLSISEKEEDIAEDMKLVREGYDYLVRKKYDKAKSSLEKALEVNPSNPYALFNLGLVYERQGNKEQAMLMYQKIIALNLDVTGKTSGAPYRMEQSVVDLARERLLKNLEEDLGASPQLE